MPAKKRTAPARSQKKIEKYEILFLCLPLVCLASVLLIVFLNNNAASGKPSSNPVATSQAAILATSTPASTATNPPTPPASTVPAASTTIAATTAIATPGSALTSTATATIAPGSSTSPVATQTAVAVQTVKPGSPEGSGIRLTKTEGGLKFDLLVSPGHIGDNTYSLLLSENGNQAVTDARLVRLSVTSLDMDMGVANLDLQPAGPDQPGLYSGLDSKLQMLSMFGKYNVAVLVQRTGKSDTTASFQLMVTGS